MVVGRLSFGVVAAPVNRRRVDDHYERPTTNRQLTYRRKSCARPLHTPDPAASLTARMRRLRPEEQRRPQGRRGVWHLKLMTLSVCVAGAYRSRNARGKKRYRAFSNAVGAR